VRAKVLRVCNAYRSDPYAQRHHFWRHYAESAAAATTGWAGNSKLATSIVTASAGSVQTQRGMTNLIFRSR
jgi:hypothetical protein